MGRGGGETNFSSHTLESLKAMVRDAQPDKVDEIADHWMYVHDQLAGDAPDGCVRDLLDKAVADVLEYWHGAAADAFAKRARTLSKSLKNGSLYAKNTSHILKGAASDLREAKRSVTQLQDTESEKKGGNIVTATFSAIGDGVDKVGDDWFGGGRDDSGLNRDISKGMSADEARAKHADSLSRGREIALQAASHMEKLGASYNEKASLLADAPAIIDKRKRVSSPSTLVPLPTVPSASASQHAAGPRKVSTSSSAGGRGAARGGAAPGALSSPNATQTGGRADQGTSQGETHQPMPKEPRAGTALDGVRGGLRTPTAPPATGPGGPVVGGSPNNPGAGPGVPGVPPGGWPTVGGRGPSGGRVSRPATPGVGNTPPGGRGASRGLGAPGAPGQQGQAGRPPIGGAVGPGGSGKAGSRGRQGGLARRPGGVVGEPANPGTGRGSQGGSGLHRSRGGSLQNGPGGASRARGPMGVPPVGRSGRDDRERRGSSRPDYLIEDEETWAPQRDVVPGVVGVSDSEESGDTDVPEERNREAGPESSAGSGRA